MKKMLVPVDLQKPEKRINGFIYPDFASDQVVSFVELDKMRKWDIGMVVYTGKEISKDDLFARIVDSGRTIVSVEDLLAKLDNFLYQLSQLKIGDYVKVESTETGFSLMKVSRPRQGNNRFP